MGTSSGGVAEFLNMFRGILSEICKSLDSLVNNVSIKSTGESVGTMVVLSFYTGKGSVIKGRVVSKSILFLMAGSTVEDTICVSSVVSLVSLKSLQVNISAC